MADALTASGGLCAPLSAEYDPFRWRPRFVPLRGWRGWWTRGDAGGMLLGHVTLPRPKPMTLPAFTASRGGITYAQVPHG